MTELPRPVAKWVECARCPDYVLVLESHDGEAVCPTCYDEEIAALKMQVTNMGDEIGDLTFRLEARS